MVWKKFRWLCSALYLQYMQFHSLKSKFSKFIYLDIKKFSYTYIYINYFHGLRICFDIFICKSLKLKFRVTSNAFCGVNNSVVYLKNGDKYHFTLIYKGVTVFNHRGCTLVAPLCYLNNHCQYLLYYVCSRSSDPFHKVSYYIKWVTTSWTHSISARCRRWVTRVGSWSTSCPSLRSPSPSTYQRKAAVIRFGRKKGIYRGREQDRETERADHGST